MFIDNGIKLWDIEYKLGNQFLNCVASNYYTIYSLECARNMNVFDDKCANDIVIRKMIYGWKNNVPCTICPKFKYWFSLIFCSLLSILYVIDWYILANCYISYSLTISLSREAMIKYDTNYIAVSFYCLFIYIGNNEILVYASNMCIWC